MSLALDHILIAVHALPAAVRDYAALGFHVRPGPSAPGTESAFVDFPQGARLQLLAWTAPTPQDGRWQRLQLQGEGIAGYALTSQARSVEGTAAPAGAHANGALGIESLAIAVRDVDAELARLCALAGAADADVHLGMALTLPIAGTRLATVQLAGSALLLMAPGAARAAAQEPHPLSLRLAACGEGPYALVLRSRHGPAWTPDLRRTHGAAIEFVPASAPAAAPPVSAAMVGG